MSTTNNVIAWPIEELEAQRRAVETRQKSPDEVNPGERIRRAMEIAGEMHETTSNAHLYDLAEELHDVLYLLGVQLDGMGITNLQGGEQ